MKLARERRAGRRDSLLVDALDRGRARSINTSARSTSCCDAAGLQALAGDQAKVFEDLAVFAENLVGFDRGKEVAVSPLDGGDRVELRGGQFRERDLHVALGRLTAQPQGAEPGELLGERQVVGVVPHQEVLRCDARDRKHDVRGDGVIERGRLRNSVLERLDVVIGRLDGSVFGQGARWINASTGCGPASSSGKDVGSDATDIGWLRFGAGGTLRVGL